MPLKYHKPKPFFLLLHGVPKTDGKTKGFHFQLPTSLVFRYRNPGFGGLTGGPRLSSSTHHLPQSWVPHAHSVQPVWGKRKRSGKPDSQNLSTSKNQWTPKKSETSVETKTSPNSSQNHSEQILLLGINA